MEKNTRNQKAESLFRDRYGNSPNIMSPNIHARNELSQSFGSLAEAESYIESLRDWRPAGGEG